MKVESIQAARAAYDIEAQCILEMKDYFDEVAFSRAVHLLAQALRIGAAGCGHSGIICQHFAHLMCCIERPARPNAPAVSAADILRSLWQAHAAIHHTECSCTRSYRDRLIRNTALKNPKYSSLQFSNSIPYKNFSETILFGTTPRSLKTCFIQDWLLQIFLLFRLYVTHNLQENSCNIL